MSNKTNPRTLSGFMELMPQEQISFNKIKNTIEEVYSNYGFYPLDTPVIESSEVLLAKTGGDTEKQIYRFSRGDNDLSLRFDLTVPLAKYVASRYGDLVFPFKRYQIGKVYRGERAQKGRFREFYQCDIDVIGNEELSILYDADIPSIIYDIFKKLDFGDFVIRINNRKIMSGFFENIGLNDKITEILRVIDKIDKVGIGVVKKELKDLDIDESKIDLILGFLQISGNKEEKLNLLKEMNIDNPTFTKGIEELEFVINNLKARKLNYDNYDIDLTIARGLDYYTGTVYETFLKDYPSIGSVCSGGRYDDLASFYTDKKLPGVGISIGLTRLFYQLNEAKIINNDFSAVADVIVLPLTNNYAYVFDVVNRLRENNIRVDIIYADKFKQMIKYADRQKVKSIIIIGDDEIDKNVVIFKNMVTGEQEEININDILPYCSKRKIKK